MRFLVATSLLLTFLSLHFSELIHREYHVLTNTLEQYQKDLNSFSADLAEDSLTNYDISDCDFLKNATIHKLDKVNLSVSEIKKITSKVVLEVDFLTHETIVISNNYLINRSRAPPVLA